MQTRPSAYPRWMNRLAISPRISLRQLHLKVIFAVWLVGITTACCSLTGAEPTFDFVGPARCEQPRPADEVGALISLPPVEVIEPTTYCSLSVPSLATPDAPALSSEPYRQLTEYLQQVHYLQASVKRLASKWRTNLQFEDVEENTASQPSEGEVLALPEAEEDSAANGMQCYQPVPLHQVTVDIAIPAGKLPQSAYHECISATSFQGDARLSEGWMQYDYHWAATGLCHRPLYFEEVNAERFGYTPSYALQPAISALRFFSTIPALPYKMMVDRPCDCTYTLGHYRPGSCNPYRWHRLPLRVGAATVEVGFIAGMVLLFP